MPTSSQCPAEGTLRAYLDRQLPAAEQARVAGHLAGCAECATAAAILAAQAQGVNMALEKITLPAPGTAAAWQRFNSEHMREASHAPLTASYALRILSWRFENMSRSLRTRWQPAMIGAALALFLIALFTVAPLRAAAAQFLDIFRVRKLAVVQVNTGQIERLESYRNQVFSQPKIDKAAPVHVDNAPQASQAAGFQVLAPEFVPGGLGGPKEFAVEPGGHAQTTVNLAAARTLLHLADLPTDAIPATGDSMDVSADLKPTVGMHYRAADGASLTIVQGISPDVHVPAGVDLARIGEVGLQLLGMSPEAAHGFSQSVDWATTLVMPVPQDMASVEEVTVRGVKGYFMAGAPRTAGKAGTPSAVIWQDKGLLYLVEGEFGRQTLLHVAESLR